MRALRAALAFALVLAATPALAQDAAFDEGVAALRAERYEAAAAAFRRSYEQEARAETACNLALTYDRWAGHKEEAVDAYLQCAQNDESGRFRDHALARASALRSQRTPAEPEELPTETTQPAGPDEVEPEEIEPTVPVVPHRAQPERSRALLIVGGVTAVIGAGLIAGGAVMARNGRQGVDELWLEFPSGVIDTEQGLDDLDRVEGLRRRALAFYISGGVVAAAGLALVAIDLALGSGEDTPHVRLEPTWGGATATLSLQLR